MVAALLGLCGQKNHRKSQQWLRVLAYLRSQPGVSWALQSPRAKGRQPRVGQTRMWGWILDVQPWGYQPVPQVCLDTPVPRMLLGTDQGLRVALEESPASPGQEVK